MDLKTNIKNIIVSSGLATSNQIKINTQQEIPDKQISIIEYGSNPLLSDLIERRFQFLIRDTKDIEAERLSWKIYNLLAIPDAVEYNGRNYFFVAIQTPKKLEIDSKNRVSYVFSVQVTAENDDF